MKKVLAFLLLFVAGIALLLWIERPKAVESPPLPEVRAPYPPERPEDAAEARERDVSLPIPAESSIGVRGEVELGKRVTEGKNRGHKLYDLLAKDSRSIEDRVELFGITASLYDEDSGEEVLRLAAKTGGGTIKPTEQGLLGGFQLGPDLELHGVEVTLLRDAPVVPLTLRSENLVGTLEGGHFRTDGRVEISGKGLDASGVGFEFQVDRGLLRFFHEGVAEVEVEPGRIARLTCDDELAIASPPQGPRRISMDASGNANITLEGREAVALGAEHIRILGRPREGGSEPFGFDRIEAEGDVRLATPTSAFFAERAEIALQGSTTRFTATLHGEPNGYFAFQGSAAPLIGEEKPRELTTISFRGDGPLEVTRTEALDFALPGRGELEWEGAHLTANDSITGRFGPVLDEFLFVARGGVSIVRPEGALETEEFRLSREPSSEAQERLSASASGPAKLVGRADSEHTFELETVDQIDIALDGEVWRVPRASGVRLVVLGPNGFTARANQVLEFSEEPLGLVASGDVVLEAADGTLRGDRLEVQGPDHLIVEGTVEEPTKFRWERAEGVARRVERSGELVIAEDVERVSFAHDESTYEFACGRLLVSQDERTDSNGAVVGTIRISARGDVRAARLEDRIELDCQELEGVLSRHEKDGEFLYSSSTLTATGRVTARFERKEIDCELTSDKVQCEHSRRALQELSSFRLLAQGNVAIENRGLPPIRGEGDEFEFDDLNRGRYRGRLVAFEDRRVRAEGYWPESLHPFTMTCRWIQFSPSFIAAADPEGELVWTNTSKEGGEAVHVRARSQMVEADRERIALVGNVSLEDVGGGPRAWGLTADRARIEMREAAGDHPLRGIRASGSVVFRYGPGLRAFGDELTGRAEQLSVRITGSPARIFHRGLRWKAEWIEYDLLLNLFSTGRVLVEPVPKGDQPK